MKLATYYRIEENQFCRLLSPNEQELNNYEKIYFFSELGKKLLVPPQFLRSSNVIYGGSAFTNDMYIPFENEIIDYTIPRISIYQSFLKQKFEEGVKTKIISRVLDNTYYRMYAGNNKLPIPTVQPGKKVYIFDREFFCPDWRNIIEDLSSRRPSSIYCIHPIICKTITDFFTIREIDKISKNTEIILDLNIPLDEVDYMLKKYKKFFLETIVKTSKIYLPLRSDKITLEQYSKELYYILNLLYAFWARDIPIKIYLFEPKIGFNNPILELEQKIANWSSTSFQKNNFITINERIRRNKKICKQRDLIIERFPYMKSLFDQEYKKLAERRYWRL